MAMLITIRKGNYTNSDAVENVIRYITRTRANEDRAYELIAWGGMGIGTYQTPELAIEQFRILQRVHRIETRGSRMFHEVLRLTDGEFGWLEHDYGRVYQVALNCAQHYYAMGHQVVFAIHQAKKDCQGGNQGLHIHFAVNTINFMTGNKWHSNIRENITRDRLFNGYIWKFMSSSAFETREFQILCKLKS